MIINNTYINEKNVVVVEPYVMDFIYGIKVNDIPVEIERSTNMYSKEDKEEILKRIKKDYIRVIIENK